LFPQQSWLTPPFASTQRPSASRVWHAGPVHSAVQPDPLHASSCTVIPWLGSPGCGRQGFEPASVDVPVTRGSLMSSVPTA